MSSTMYSKTCLRVASSVTGIAALGVVIVARVQFRRGHGQIAFPASDCGPGIGPGAR
jgi:hypothetical protein